MIRYREYHTGLSIAERLAPSVTVSHPRRSGLLATPLLEPQISQYVCVLQLLCGVLQGVCALSSCHAVAFIINV